MRDVISPIPDGMLFVMLIDKISFGYDVKSYI